MFELHLLIRIVLEFELARQAALEAGRDNTQHALAGIRKDARESIHKSTHPSRPGTPPHTRRGLLSSAGTILYALGGATPEAAVIGFVGAVASKVGTSAGAQEHGGRYKGQNYPARPFMEPAMLGRLSDFAGSFAGSIGA